jgi:hypothetical protein
MTLSQALVNDGVRSFLVLQLLLLALMLYAVIRLPPFSPGSTGEASQASPARPAAVQMTPLRPVPAPAGAWPQEPPASAGYAQFPPAPFPPAAQFQTAQVQTAQVPAAQFTAAEVPARSFAGHQGAPLAAGSGRMRSGKTKYVARHVASPEPRTIRRPKVSGSPPWGPAPRPPGYLP